MKKTLKFLLAIMLFVAVLVIATGVNAAEVKDTNATMNMETLKRDGYLTYNRADDVYEFVSSKSFADMKVKLDKDATVDLMGADLEDVVITGNVTLKSTTLTDSDGASVTGSIEDVTVKGNLTTEMDLGDVYLVSGTITLKDGVTVDDLKTYTNYTIAKNAKGTINTVTANTNDVVITSKATTAPDFAKGSKATDNFVIVSDEDGNTYYASEEKVVFNTILRDIETGRDVNLSAVELDKTYAIRAEATLNGSVIGPVAIKKLGAASNDRRIVLSASAIRHDVTNDTKHGYYEIEFTEYFKEDGSKVTLTYSFDDEQEDDKTVTIERDVELTAKAAENTPTPTATAEAPATTAPANGDEKDTTPKTGDQIIPATALLAVVVVANVVYFAKSKRS